MSNASGHSAPPVDLIDTKLLLLKIDIIFGWASHEVTFSLKDPDFVPDDGPYLPPLDGDFNGDEDDLFDDKQEGPDDQTKNKSKKVSSNSSAKSKLLLICR